MGGVLIAEACDDGGSYKRSYGFDPLEHFLILAGFKDIKRRKHPERQTPDFTILEPENRELDTVFVEAVK